MTFSSLLDTYISGVLLLTVAIVLNIFAQQWGVSTWYDYLFTASSTGIVEATKAQSILSLLFLFVVYPLVLGATVVTLANRVFS